MRESLGLAIVVYGIVLAGSLTAAAVAGRRRPPVLTVALLVLQAAALLAGLLDGLALTTGRHGPEVATNLGYLLTVVAVLPLTAVAVRAEDGRWANAGFAVGCLLLVVVTVRLQQTLVAPRG